MKFGVGLVVGITASLALISLKRDKDDESMISTEGFDLRVDPETGELIKCPR